MKTYYKRRTYSFKEAPAEGQVKKKKKFNWKKAAAGAAAIGATALAARKSGFSGTFKQAMKQGRYDQSQAQAASRAHAHASAGKGRYDVTKDKHWKKVIKTATGPVKKGELKGGDKRVQGVRVSQRKGKKSEGSKDYTVTDTVNLKKAQRSLRTKARKEMYKQNKDLQQADDKRIAAIRRKRDAKRGGYKSESEATLNKGIQRAREKQREVRNKRKQEYGFSEGKHSRKMVRKYRR